MELTDELCDHLYTIDFETYYDDEYSLSKMTTEQYISDPRFEVLMVSVKQGNRPAVVFDGDDSATRRYLAAEIGIENKGAIAHNMHFDGGILAFHYGLHPKAMFDTRLMARPWLMHKVPKVSLKNVAEILGIGVKGEEVVLAKGKRRKDFTPDEWERYKRYCANDTDLEWQIFKRLYPLFPQSELALIHNSLTWFTKPILRLDADLLQQYLIEVVEKKEALLRHLPGGVGKDELMSNPKFATVLQECGYSPPVKLSPTTGEPTWAFAKKDPEFIDFQNEHEGDETLEALLAARLGHKSTGAETRAQRLLGIAKRRGDLPVPLTYWAAHTGRFGGSDGINLQNLQRKSPLRRAIMAPPGHLCVVPDQSQIEARINAWISGEIMLVDAFARGDDPYSLFASAVYDLPVNKEDYPDERFVGKQGILGLGYGAAAEKFQIMLKGFKKDKPLDFCTHVVNTYRNKYQAIVRNWGQFDRMLWLMVRGPQESERHVKHCLYVEQGSIVLPNGMRLMYPGLFMDESDRTFWYISKGSKVHIYGAKLVENTVQALARIILTDQINELMRMGFRVALTVHDEILAVVRESEVEQAMQAISEVMRRRPSWGNTIPLDIEINAAERYGDAK
jgi:DNA polymerase